VQPETAKYEVFRQPQLRFLGARAICAIEGTPRIAVATFVSPDATAPGQEPDSAKLLFFDTETNSFVDEAVPLPGCKVIAGIIQIPGTRKLVGIGLHDAVPDADSDDSFTGPGTVFVYDLDAAKTGLQEVFPYPICGREGRPLTVAPDGSVWFSGGGGIFRVEPCGTAIEALAACGARGNMVFLNGSVFMDGGKGIRWADIRNLISKEK
jgi:streptogramin lyase